MPVSKKPRKKYRGPKIIPGQMPPNIRHSDEADQMLQLVPHEELEKFRNGTADKYTVNTLAFRLNWGYVMAGEYFDTPEAREAMIKGLDAIKSVTARVSRTGQYGASQLEFQAMGVALGLTDEMQKMSTRREQRDSLRAVYLVNEYKREKA